VFGEAGSRSSLVRVWSLRLSVTSIRSPERMITNLFKPLDS